MTKESRSTLVLSIAGGLMGSGATLLVWSIVAYLATKF